MTQYDKNGYPVSGGGGSTSYDHNGYPASHSGGGGGGSKPVGVGRFGAIPGGVAAAHAVGFGGGILGNAVNQASGIITGIPHALVTTGQATWHDLSGGKVNDPRLNDWSFLFKHPIGYGQAWLHDPSTFGGTVVKPQIDVTRKDVNELRKGNWNYFARNPLNPVLDIASVLSVGGKGALMAGRTGALGEYAAGLANKPRLLTVGDHTEVLSQAKTLQGRIRQDLFDRYSMANPDKAFVGANLRMKRILTTRAATATLRAGLSARKFAKTTEGFSPAEVFAFHVGAEGVPLDDRIAYYQAQLAEAEASGGATRPLREYLQNLTAPAVRDVLTNPSPRFTDALWAGKELEGKAGQRLMDTGQLSAETRASRAALPQREMLPDVAASPPEGLFHGTRKRFEGDVPGDIYSTGSGAGNLYGHGFYTTDAHDIASTYTRKGGATEDQFVYRVDWNGQGKPNLLDLDEHAHPTVKRWGQEQLKQADAGHFDVTVESYDELVKALERGSSGDVIRAARRMWASTGEIPKFEVDDMVSGLSELLAAEGYDGLKHVGGTLAGGGKKLHNVSIFFDTKNIKLSPSELPPVRPEPTMGSNLVHPDFPPPFRFPHVATARSEAAFYKAPHTSQMLGKVKDLDQLKYNSGTRMRNALFQTDPRVLTHDFLQTMRHEELLNMQHEAFDKIAQPLDAALGPGGRRKEEWYYRPSYDRKTTAPVKREVREAEALSQDAIAQNAEISRESVAKGAKSVVSQDPKDLLTPQEIADGVDLSNVERLNELGIKRVPAAFGRDFHTQYTRSHWAIRYFYDRPLDVWRALTLNFRPAWAVNNFVGNAIMGLARYGPEGALQYLRVLGTLEKGDQKIRRIRNFTFSHPTLRRKYGNLFGGQEGVAPELHSAGLFGTQTHITHAGAYEGKLADFLANPAVKVLGFVPKKVGQGLLGVGKGITKVETLFAEDTGREAAFIIEAGGDLEKIRAVARAMGEGNIALAEALKRLDKPSVERAVRGVGDAMGDFNDLSGVERSVLRRAIPFYAWYKVITKVSGKYAARYPARILLLKNIEQAQNTDGEPALPPWLAGALRRPGARPGYQRVISTQGINPYETLNQLSGGEGVGAFLTPFADAAGVGLFGRTARFGKPEDYYGIGANNRGNVGGQLEMAAGSFLENFAPFKLYQSQTQPYQGHAYDPTTYRRNALLQYLGLPIRDVKTGG